MIFGEIGMGKEFVVCVVYEYSLWVEMLFVVVNCGVLFENLIESELFGYCWGVFIGVDEYWVGFFEVVDGGIIFFDEIGEFFKLL